MRSLTKAVCATGLLVCAQVKAFPTVSAKTLGYEAGHSETASSTDESIAPVMKAVASESDNFQNFIQQVQLQRQEQVKIAPPDIKGLHVTPAEVKKWTPYFDNVIVINKAQSVQKLVVYRFGQKIEKEFPIST